MLYEVITGYHHLPVVLAFQAIFALAILEYPAVADTGLGLGQGQIGTGQYLLRLLSRSE